MENIQIEDEKGDLIVGFDGEIWKIYSGYNYDNPEIIYHDNVKESPFYLYSALEGVGNPSEIANELAQKSSVLKNLFEDFFEEKTRLKGRIILVEKKGNGVFDEFIDRISLSGNSSVGFIVEATIEDDLSFKEFNRNAIGEIITVIAEDIINADGLCEAIHEITSDERWENIKWTWEEIFSHLVTQHPKLAHDLKQIIEERGDEPIKIVKNEKFYFGRIESFIRARKYDLALDCVNEGIEFFPFCEILFAARGDIYYLKNLIDNAIKDYESAIQLGIDEPLLLNNLGHCYLIKHEYSRAVKCFYKKGELEKENINDFLLGAIPDPQFKEARALLAEREAAKLESEKLSIKQKEKCEIHGIKLEEKEIQGFREFVSYSDEDAFIKITINKVEAVLFPNAQLLIPDTLRNAEDGYSYHNKYLICSECKKEKEEWIINYEGELFRSYREEKGKSQDDLLAECDFDTWVDFAGKFVKKRSLTEKEIDEIRILTEKKEIENLGKFVTSLSSTRISKIKDLCKKFISRIKV